MLAAIRELLPTRIRSTSSPSSFQAPVSWAIQTADCAPVTAVQAIFALCGLVSATDGPAAADGAAVADAAGAAVGCAGGALALGVAADWQAVPSPASSGEAPSAPSSERWSS